MTENKVKPDSVPPMTCQQMPWLSKDIQHARDAIEYLACRINLAYESGELDAADVIDGELEHLYEFMETALGDLEEDGIELNSRTDPSGYRNRHLRTQVGDSVDVEHGPIEILAACYEEAFVRRRPPFGLETMEDKISYLRGAIDDCDGKHEDRTDEYIIDAARDAYQNTGREKAWLRPGRNPVYEHTLLRAEAVLRGDSGRGKPSIVAGDDSIRQMGDASEVGPNGDPYNLDDIDDVNDIGPSL
jgi:hypothetical protein